MLNNQVQTENRYTFINLLRNIKRPYARIDELITYLESSDFFTAPASTRYHNNVEGGLVDHCLKVYQNLRTLYESKFLTEFSTPEVQESLIVVALCHDFDKINKYEPSVRNVKTYCEDGDKYDDLGKFKWVAKKGWTTRETGKRLVYGSHEMNSEYLARCFIPLTVEESVAILHHMGCMAHDSAQDNISEVFTEYPLALLLHQADCLATYIDEKGEK